MFNKIKNHIEEERRTNDAARAAEDQKAQERRAAESTPENIHIREVAAKAGDLAETAAYDSGASRNGAFEAKLGAISQAAAGLVLDQERQHEGKVDHQQGRHL